MDPETYPDPPPPDPPHPAALPDDVARRAAVLASAPGYWGPHEDWVGREMAAGRLLLAFAAEEAGAAPAVHGGEIGALAARYAPNAEGGAPGPWGKQALRAAAAHPNTPAATLAWLARRCPEDLVRNPVLPLLLLEAPAVLRDAGTAALQAMLASPHLPAAVAEALAAGVADGAGAVGGEPHGRFADDWCVREGARLHVSLAGEAEADEGWAARVRAWYAGALHAAYQEEDGEFPLYYGQPGGKRSGAALERLHLRPDFAEAGLAPPEPLPGEPPFAEPVAPAFTPPRRAKPAAIAAALAEAENPATDPKRLLALAADARSWEVKYAVARNPSAGREALVRLSRRDCPPELRLLVLQHPSISPALVKHLAITMDPLVRRAARRHPLAGVKIVAASVGHVRGLLAGQHGSKLTLGPRLARLALLLGPDADVREVEAFAVAPSRRMTPSWLDRLGVALSPHFSPGGALDAGRADLLTPLAGDGNSWVRAAARRRLAEPAWEFGAPWGPPGR